MDFDSVEQRPTADLITIDAIGFGPDSPDRLRVTVTATGKSVWSGKKETGPVTIVVSVKPRLSTGALFLQDLRLISSASAMPGWKHSKKPELRSTVRCMLRSMLPRGICAEADALGRGEAIEKAKVTGLLCTKSGIAVSFEEEAVTAAR